MRHDTKVDVVPVTSHDHLRHSMVILPQNVLTIHRVYVLTNLKQSTCTTLNKVYTMYSVFRQPNSQRDSSRMKIFDGRLDVDVRQIFQSWRVSLRFRRPMHTLNDTVKPNFAGNFFSIYPNDQVITNISIDSAVEPISSKRSNVFNCLDIRIWRWCMLRAFSLVYLTTTGIRG